MRFGNMKIIKYEIYNESKENKYYVNIYKYFLQF